jgi:hypothetical protein
MDEIVQRAMAKWPNVPAVFGWLALDLRGQWRIRQEPISNPLMVEFIGRNYGHDEHGRWFFQNGPQRVFVALAYAPWVLRTNTHGRLVTHTGRTVESVQAAWMDRKGIIVLETEHGAAVVDDRDVETISHRLCDRAGRGLDEERITAALEHIQSGEDAALRVRYGGANVPLLPAEADEIAARSAFVREPQPLPAERAG